MGGDKKEDKLVFEAGDVIFREGEKGDVAFIIEQGSVQLTKKHKAKVSVVEILRDGAFALPPLIDNFPRQYTATAREHTVLSIITREGFEKRFSKSDPAIQAVVHYLTRSLRQATNRLMNGGVLEHKSGDMK